MLYSDEETVSLVENVHKIFSLDNAGLKPDA